MNMPAQHLRAAPVGAIVASGFGTGVRRSRASVQLSAFQSSYEGISVSVRSAGRIARQLLTVISASGGRATDEYIAAQTPGAGHGVIEQAIERLIDAGLVVRSRADTVTLSETARRYIEAPLASLADQNAITSDALAQVCKLLDVIVPGLKQGRIDAIAAVFARDAAVVRASLSSAALDLLDRIALTAGPGAIGPEQVGVSAATLIGAEPMRYAFQRAPVRPEVAVLQELTNRALVGVNPYDRRLWIWAEAWPVVGQPFYRSWSSPDLAEPVAIDRSPAGIPAVVAALGQAMAFWEASPPAALKTGPPRLAKAVVKSTATATGYDEAVVELAARLAISIGLMRANTTGTTGRGRNQRVERAWMSDPTMAHAWRELSPTSRWVRLVAEWFAPNDTSYDEVVTRQMLTWQLSALPEVTGHRSVERFYDWFIDAYWPMSSEVDLPSLINDLRLLEIVTTDGPLALTSLGLEVLERPESLHEAMPPATTTAVVQSDLSVVAPPDLDPMLLARLEAIAETATGARSGTRVFRLDATRLTRTIQSGTTVDELLDFLRALSPTPLPDTVIRLVSDAGAKAGTVRVVSATTVVIVTDPADLVTACAIKALQLVRVSDTVAVTSVSLSKVTAALARKGLTPEAVVSGASPTGRSSADEAADLATRAAMMRAAASGRAGSYFEREADMLEAQARSVSDVSARLAVSGPIAATITTLAASSDAPRPARRSGSANA